MGNKFFYGKSITIFLMFLLFTAFNSTSSQVIYDSLNVIHLTDIHVADWYGYHPDLRKKRREQYEDNQQKFVEFLNTIPEKVNADAIMTSGDNIDFYAGESIDGSAMAGQVENFVNICRKSPVPVFLTLGNHEISTFYTKAAKEKKNNLSGHFNAEASKAAWIKNAECFQNGSYYSKQFNAGGTEYLFLFLEAIYRIEGNPTDAYWNPEMVEWLNHKLEVNKDAKAVMFFHVPLPAPDNNRDGKFINKPLDGWPDDEAYKSGIMKTLIDHKNIVAMFVGHMHENIYEEIYLPDGRKIPEIETASFGENENNWRLLTFKKDLIRVSKSGGNEMDFSIIINKGR